MQQFSSRPSCSASRSSWTGSTRWTILLMLLMILLVLMFFVQFILGSGQNGENNSLFQGVTDQIRRKGEVVSDILDFLIQYKIDCVKRAEPTPIMDR